MSPSAFGKPDERPLGIGLLGHGFMGEVHARALATMSVVDPEAPPVRRVALAGRDQARLDSARERLGFDRCTADWRSLVEDAAVDVLDNVGPNALHVEPTIAAVSAGKHVLCEKPLAPSADEAWRMWKEAELAGVAHGCSFNWRFFPAVQALRQVIASQEMGPVLSMHCDFVVPRSDAGDAAWRSTDPRQGGGVIGDLLSHHIDLVRFLVGEIAVVDAAIGPREVLERSGVEDQALVLAWTESGALVSLHASRASAWPSVTGTIDVRGAERSAGFSLEALNELEERDGVAVRRRSIYEGDTTLGRYWYPRGHPLGWDTTFVHQFSDFLRSVKSRGERVTATFADGYRAAEVADAIRRSADEQRRVAVEYRGRPGVE